MHDFPPNTDERQSSVFGDRYMFAYTPLVQPVNVQLAWAAGPQVRAWWYNPRTSGATVIGEFAAPGQVTFHPPIDGPDWVLVLDDADQAFAAPGVTG